MDSAFKWVTGQMSKRGIWLTLVLAAFYFGLPPWIQALKKPEKAPRDPAEKQTALMVSIAKQCLECGKCSFNFSSNREDLREIQKLATEYSFKVDSRVPAKYQAKSFEELMRVLPSTETFPVYIQRREDASDRKSSNQE